MQKVAEIFKGCPISNYTVYGAVDFFRRKVAAGSLRAYLVVKDAEETLQDDEKVLILKITKGNSLLPIPEEFQGLTEYMKSILIEDSRTHTVYSLFSNSHGSGIGMGEDTDDDTYTTVHVTVLERHREKFDKLDLQSLNIDRGTIHFPQGSVDAKLRVDYDEHNGARFEVDPASALEDRLFGEYKEFLEVKPTVSS
jgi:hypothetical protein